MNIEKKQRDKKNCLFNWFYFDSARSGFKHILRSRALHGKRILLPAYIGYSSREGSGVFDPIRQIKMTNIFYAMDAKLNIDVESLKKKISSSQGDILLIIHYFGFIDKNIKIIKQYAKAHNMIIIEDFAHAFFTFLNDPVIDFDYGVFSIHKLFPVSSGGMIISKSKIMNSHKARYDLFNYNMNEIMKKRVDNYVYIQNLLKEKADLYGISLLKKISGGIIPHSFPILLGNKKIRDQLYFQLNKEGYGVVSLYHSLIDEIDDSFITEHNISNRILNLPVHQDVKKNDLVRMIDRMIAIVKDSH